MRTSRRIFSVRGEGPRGHDRVGFDPVLSLTKTRGPPFMGGHEGWSRVLGRMAEILLECGAGIELNEVQELLERLRRAAYAEGFEDGTQALEYRDNEAGEGAYALRFGDRGFED